MSDYCINQILFFSFEEIIYEKKAKLRTMQGTGKQKTGTGGAEPLFLFHCCAVPYQLSTLVLPDLQLGNKIL